MCVRFNFGDDRRQSLSYQRAEKQKQIPTHDIALAATQNNKYKQMKNVRKHIRH